MCDCQMVHLYHPSKFVDFTKIRKKCPSKLYMFIKVKNKFYGRVTFDITRYKF